MNGTMNVLAVGDLAPECIARLAEDGLRVDERLAWGEPELAAGVDGYVALIAGPGVPVTAAVLAAGRALKVVGRAGVDVAGIDVARGDPPRRSSSSTRRTPGSSPRPSTCSRSSWRAPATCPAPTRRCASGPPRHPGCRATEWRYVARRSGWPAWARARVCWPSAPARSA